jgi:hypothetical protein
LLALVGAGWQLKPVASHPPGDSPKCAASLVGHLAQRQVSLEVGDVTPVAALVEGAPGGSGVGVATGQDPSGDVPNGDVGLRIPVALHTVSMRLAHAKGMGSSSASRHAASSLWHVSLLSQVGQAPGSYRCAGATYSVAVSLPARTDAHRSHLTIRVMRAQPRMAPVLAARAKPMALTLRPG